MLAGLVFQGPMQSRDFACAPVLLEYARRLRSVGLETRCCLSTWDDETVPEEIAGLGWEIVRSAKPAGFDLMNRRKQLVSTTAGVQRLLATARPDVVMKVRTDLDLPVERLLEEVIAAAVAERLLFPAASERLPFYLNDFYFGGAPALFHDFLEANLSFGNVFMHAAPEMDLPMKYIFARHRHELGGLSNFACFLNPFDYPYVWETGVGRRKMERWRECRGRHFALGSRELMAEATWRGRPLVQSYGVHEALFGSFEAPPEAQFGVVLRPLARMPRKLRWFHRAPAAVEYARWKAPALERLHVLHRGLRRMHRAINTLAYA